MDDEENLKHLWTCCQGSVYRTMGLNGEHRNRSFEGIDKGT